MSSGTSLQPVACASSGSVRYVDGRAESLLSEYLPILHDPQAHEGPEVVRVKQNASRTVWRCRLGDAHYYLKQYHSRQWTHRLGNLFRGDDASREMTISRHLRSRGILATPVLAVGQSAGRRWMLSEAIEPAEPADLWHARLAGGKDKKSLRQLRQANRALAELVGRMHNAGVLHHDLHCGNVLVQSAGDGMETSAPRLTLVDLHRAGRRWRLSRRARAKNLAMLLHDRQSATRTQRLAFLRHYLEVTGGPGTLRGWWAMVQHFAEGHTRNQLRSRDRRVLGDNKYFTRLRLPGGWRGHAVLATKCQVGPGSAASCTFTPQQWRDALAEPNGLFQSPDTIVVKDSASSQVVRRSLKVGPHTLDVYVKRHRRKHWYKAPLDLFRRSRALWAFRGGQALLTRHIATAMPLAVLEQYAGPFRRTTILIAETVAPADQLTRFLNRWLGPEALIRKDIDSVRQQKLARDLLRQLGRLLLRLHNAGFAHRDLKSENMLVHWNGENEPQVVLIDLDGLSRHRRISTRRMFQGLMRLNVSLLECPAVNHAGRLRILLSYLRHPGSGRINFKPYWRELEQWSARKLRRQLKDRRKRQKRARR